MAAPIDLDLAALANHLAPRLPGLQPPLTAERFSGGQSNPTYAIDDAAGRRWVLRSKPGPVARLLPSAHAIEREYRVLDALAGSAVPVPRVLTLCEDESVTGRAFYLMERVEGRIFWDPRLPDVPRDERAAIYAAMARTQAALHAIDPAGIGLADYGAQGNFYARQIGRWSKQYRAAETDRIEAMEALMAWLPTRIPAETPARIVHGDFRIDNLVFHPEEPRVIAVLDWELSTLGDPLADFAYHLLPWFTPPGAMRGLAGCDLAELGIPTMEQHVQSYCTASGRSEGIPDLPFCIAYNLFRLAAIAQGIAQRARQGTASSDKAREAGALARPVAELAWRIAQEGER